MLSIRSHLFTALFYLLTAVLAILGLPYLAFNRLAVQSLARIWVSASLWLLEKICRIKVEFRGLENLPAGACLIAAKHQSTLETLALPLAAHDFSFVLKRELVAIPIFGWYLQRAEQVAIDRAKRGQALSDLNRQVRQALAQGRQIIIFPEGTRRPVDAPLQYKAGVAHLYVEAGAVCVPVALNTGLFWPRGNGLRRPGTAVIAFLEPIGTGLDKQSFMTALETRIEAATAKLVAEALAADPSLKGAAGQPRNVAAL
ncbi:lysophospholipid acyltransferase family protein [Methylocapsa acidiphila]|uniref:lysophospholipid acyltransferase family protein n=1 Tax=Methylocapsa acidiphila TaxID=133552 RepID=UPI000405017D|nr:lysophospholipid acyltransferase family protein [Methylocapsa acidiphila]